MPKLAIYRDKPSRFLCVAKAIISVLISRHRAHHLHEAVGQRRMTKLYYLMVSIYGELTIANFAEECHC
jgi:hypothetical protein